MSRAPLRLEPEALACVDSALTTTRAIRRRLDLSRPVPRSLLREALQVAHQGPSGGAEEPIRWVVVTDSETRRRIGEVYRRAYRDLDAERPAPRGPGAERILRVRASSAYLARIMPEVPVQVLVCSAGPAPEGGHGALAAKFYGSVYPAVWSLQVALRARGLGSCLTTVGLRREQELTAAAGLATGWTCCALVPVAQMTGSDLGPAPRGPLNEVTRWI